MCLGLIRLRVRVRVRCTHARAIEVGDMMIRRVLGKVGYGACIYAGGGMGHVI